MSVLFWLLNLMACNEDFRIVVFYILMDCRISSLPMFFSICLCNLLCSAFHGAKLFQCSYGRVFVVRLQDCLHGYRRGWMHFHSWHSAPPVLRHLVQFAVSQHCSMIQTFSCRILLLLVNSFLKPIQ